ncbi:hypothetical protein LOD99_3520 [Oopsacas minuta]|uniref:NAD-dependent epimerase/dehydratase domain-containing protein n=1 Tax=Oopsacas minuta TaxID=111878 RepID=A0AAV7JXT1_9METZ|nr:hypothetical protein LOD99_3520 [Oopsacas minuta]
MAEADIKPSVLILGGCGFVGRSIAMYLLEEKLANKVCIVDKLAPVLFRLTEKEQELFTKIEFRSGNLSKPEVADKCFEGSWDIVVNAAAETRYAQSDAVYKERISTLGVICARTAVNHGCKRFIQFSSARVYKSSRNPNKENSELKPTTTMHNEYLLLEQEIAKIEGLNYIIIRTADIYGPGMNNSSPMLPRIVVGAIYKYIGESMMLLWSKSLEMNVVHITDVCRATWLLTSKGESGDVYNLADKGSTTQGSLCEVLSAYFGIKYSFIGSLVTHAVGVEDAKEYSNEKHVAPWTALCALEGINTSITPYLNEELLTDYEVCVNGSKIEALGFQYIVPEFNLDRLKEVVDDLVARQQFPKHIPSKS